MHNCLKFRLFRSVPTWTPFPEIILDNNFRPIYFVDINAINKVRHRTLNSTISKQIKMRIIVLISVLRIRLRMRIRIRIHRIHVILGLLDPDPLDRSMDPDPDLDPSIFKQK